MAKISPDLRPLSGAQWFWRGQFELEHARQHLAIDVDYFDFSERSNLYIDGKLAETKKGKARFTLADGTSVESEMSLYGMKYVRHVGPQGHTSFRPAAGTAEKWRADFEARFPRLSATIAATSWTVLAIAAITQVPVLINIFGSIVASADAIPHDGWTVPTFNLPNWANITLASAGIAAALDRALRLKHNPLIDE